MIAAALDAPASTSLRPYFDLLKPRVMALVVFTGYAGLAVAPGAIHPLMALVALVSIALSAGGAGAINMWFDHDIDAVMSRTQARPIPMGLVQRGEALTLGSGLVILSTFMMAFAVNWTAAALNLGAALFYVLIYTMKLKRSTPQNIVIGGAAGALPPMIGWAAVTGDVSWASFSLFLIIFLWTPPHFWALALIRADDYARANVPMLPSTHGESATKLQMVIYTVLMVASTALPYVFKTAGIAYLGTSLVLGAIFLTAVVQFAGQKILQPKKAGLIFGYSIFYLFMVYLMLIIDKISV